MEKMVLDDKGIIELAMKYGYKGKGFESAEWKSKKSLLTNGNVQLGVLKVINQVYAKIEIEGKRKNRVYTLSEKFDEVQPVKHNYKGKVLTDEQLLMKECIFSELLKLQILSDDEEKEFELIPLTNKKWMGLVGLYAPHNFDIDKKENEIEFLYPPATLTDSPKYIVSRFYNSFSRYNRDNFHNLMNHLEKEGRIKRTTHYQYKDADGEMQYMTESHYNIIEKQIKDLVESNGFDYVKYKWQVTSPYKSSDVRAMEKLQRSFLLQEHELEYTLKLTSIEVLTNKVENVQEKDLKESFTKHFINLLSVRTGTEAYTESLNMIERFDRTNTLVLLNMVSKFVDKDMLSEVKEALPTQLAKFYDDVEFDRLSRKEINGNLLIADMNRAN